ncbi:effector-associated constant component EACC1 (plasmid) [Streptomyces sp. C1-1]|uniref:effector-associated constant component EACC1 n=1 Tax=Streptomyces sp. C1-1 TaxID=3231173 RepID=UPI003D020380
MNFLIEQLKDDSDDLRHLRRTLGKESVVDRVDEVRAPVPEGALGGELTGLLVHVAPEVCTMLTSVLVGWLHMRRGRLRLTFKKQSDGSAVVILDSRSLPKETTAAVQTFLTTVQKATESTDPAAVTGDSSQQPGPAA